MSIRRRQSPRDRAARLREGRCPVHGTVMLHVDWYCPVHGAGPCVHCGEITWERMLGCPRRDCDIRCHQARYDEPAYLLAAHSHLICEASP